MHKVNHLHTTWRAYNHWRNVSYTGFRFTKHNSIYCATRIFTTDCSFRLTGDKVVDQIRWIVWCTIVRCNTASVSKRMSQSTSIMNKLYALVSLSYLILVTKSIHFQATKIFYFLMHLRFIKRLIVLNY